MFGADHMIAQEKKECWFNVYTLMGDTVYSMHPSYSIIATIRIAAETPFKLIYRIHVRLK